jgi:hypothetical protein
MLEWLVVCSRALCAACLGLAESSCHQDHESQEFLYTFMSDFFNKTSQVAPTSGRRDSCTSENDKVLALFDLFCQGLGFPIDGREGLATLLCCDFWTVSAILDCLLSVRC